VGGESQGGRDSASPRSGPQTPHTSYSSRPQGDLTRAPVGTLPGCPRFEHETLVGEYKSSSKDLYEGLVLPHQPRSLQRVDPGIVPRLRPLAACCHPGAVRLVRSLRRCKCVRSRPTVLVGGAAQFRHSLPALTPARRWDRPPAGGCRCREGPSRRRPPPSLCATRGTKRRRCLGARTGAGKAGEEVRVSFQKPCGRLPVLPRVPPPCCTGTSLSSPCVPDRVTRYLLSTSAGCRLY
jgi:hypothetical protein